MIKLDTETTTYTNDDDIVWYWKIADLIESGIPETLLDGAIRTGALNVEECDGEPAIREDDFETWKKFGMSDPPTLPSLSLKSRETMQDGQKPPREHELLWNKDSYLKWAWYNDPDLYPVLALQYTFEWTKKTLARRRKISDQEAREILVASRKRYRDDHRAGWTDGKRGTSPPSNSFLDDARAKEVDEKMRLRHIIESWRD